MDYTYLGWLVVQVIIAVFLLVHNKNNWGRRNITQFVMVLLCVTVTIICMFFYIPMWIPTSLFAILAILNIVLERKKSGHNGK